MQYELSKQEAQLIEAYRNLLPEFQKAFATQIKTLNELQTRVLDKTFKAL